MMLVILRLFLVCFPLALLAQYPLQQAVKALVQDPQLQGANLSICAIDLQTGDTLLAYNPRQALPGASITKLVSTAAALAVLGPDYRAKTQLVLEGYMKPNGIWEGNLRIVGGGDVSLGSRYFNTAGNELQFLDEWFAVISAAGIKCITGQIIADGASFGAFTCPLGWQQVDMGNYYGCGAFGLNFYDNTLKLNFQTGSSGKPLQLKGIYPTDQHYQLRIEAVSAAISSDQTFIHGVPFDDTRVIKGKLPANRSVYEVKASMPDPERLLAEMFYQKLQAGGIRVDGGAFSSRFLQMGPSPVSTKVIHTTYGQTLKDIIYHTNQRSINLFAEGNLLQIGYKGSGAGTYEQSLIILDSLLAQWQIGPCRIVDGSGLSKENRMSAAQYTQLLAVQCQQSYFSSYLASLPIVGSSGTVKNLCKGQAAQGKVYAKSGSISGIKAYAGYVDLPNGGRAAFALIANDYTISGAAMAGKFEPILNALATYQAQPE